MRRSGGGGKEGKEGREPAPPLPFPSSSPLYSDKRAVRTHLFSTLFASRRARKCLNVQISMGPSVQFELELAEVVGK
jgi:hypothetical protein